MTEQGRELLLEYAEFIGTRHVRPVTQTPLDIPRPDQETVIAAIRRLSETYPMLDRTPLLSEASGLMAQHVMHAIPAAQVIDELERVFQTQYQAFLARRTPG